MIKGEWFIDDYGTATPADGDVGANHEQTAFYSILEIDPEDHEIPEMIPGDSLSDEAISYLRANGIAEEKIEFFKDGADARDYAIEHLGWIRVAGDNCQMWEFSNDALERIKGASEIWEDCDDPEGVEVSEDTLYIEQYKDNKTFSPTFKELFEATSVGSLIGRQERNPQHNPLQSNQTLKEFAKQYCVDRGLPPPQRTAYQRADPNAAEIAAFYDQAPNEPYRYEVRQAYSALIEEVAAQYEALPIKIVWVGDGQYPYKDSQAMMDDIAQNGRLSVYSGGADHPLMTRDENNRFRAVHDALGHATIGATFGPVGEFNAFIEHSKMFTPQARIALTVETRMQNAFVNAGPYADISPADRPYAAQKVFMPPLEWTTVPVLAKAYAKWPEFYPDRELANNPPKMEYFGDGYMFKGDTGLPIASGQDHATYMQSHPEMFGLTDDEVQMSSSDLHKAMLARGWVRLRFIYNALQAQGVKPRHVRDAVEWFITNYGMPKRVAVEIIGSRYKEMSDPEEITQFLEEGFLRDRRNPERNPPDFTAAQIRAYRDFLNKKFGVAKSFSSKSKTGARSRQYGDYLYAQDRDMFFADMSNDISSGEFKPVEANPDSEYHEIEYFERAGPMMKGITPGTAGDYGTPMSWKLTKPEKGEPHHDDISNEYRNRFANMGKYGLSMDGEIDNFDNLVRDVLSNFEGYSDNWPIYIELHTPKSHGAIVLNGTVRDFKSFVKNNPPPDSSDYENGTEDLEYEADLAKWVQDMSAKANRKVTVRDVLGRGGPEDVYDGFSVYDNNPPDEAGQWLDKAVVDVVLNTYSEYNKYKTQYTKEPNMSVTAVKEMLSYGPSEYEHQTEKKKSRMVWSALERARKDGRLGSSIGSGVDGREARNYEPPQSAEGFVEGNPPSRGIASITKFGDCLKDILNSPRGYQWLDGLQLDTWASGGCRLLADALKSIIPQSHYCGVFSNGIIQHVLVKYNGWFLDADGASTEIELLKRWSEVERLVHPSVSIISDEQVSQTEFYSSKDTWEPLSFFIYRMCINPTDGNWIGQNPPYELVQEGDIKPWSQYAQRRSFASESETRDWLFRQLELNDGKGVSSVVNGPDYNRRYADEFPVYQSGRTWKIGRPVRHRTPPLRLKDIETRYPSKESVYDIARGLTSGPFEVMHASMVSIDELLGDHDENTIYGARTEEIDRIAALAVEIKSNRWVEAVIVGYDTDGQRYIIEGQHRVRAMRELGFGSIPAISIVETQKQQ